MPFIRQAKYGVFVLCLSVLWISAPCVFATTVQIRATGTVNRVLDPFAGSMVTVEGIAIRPGDPVNLIISYDPDSFIPFPGETTSYSTRGPIQATIVGKIGNYSFHGTSMNQTTGHTSTITMDKRNQAQDFVEIFSPGDHTYSEGLPIAGVYFRFSTNDVIAPDLSPPRALPPEKILMAAGDLGVVGRGQVVNYDLTSFEGGDPNHPIFGNECNGDILCKFVVFFALGLSEFGAPGNPLPLFAFIDPPAAVGYDFQLAPGNPNIAGILLPEAPQPYTLHFFDGSPDQLIPGGVPYLFGPTGVHHFQVLGIDPGRCVPGDPCTFIPGLSFVDSGVVTLTMTTLTAPSNQSPVANAGPDQTVNEEDRVTLDGSASLDPDGNSLQYTWTQLAGPTVPLNLSDPIHPTFLAPAVSASGATLSFQLVVSDGQLSSTPATVNITVKHVNHPPVASVGPDQSVAESSLVTLDGSASYDPDADLLTYLWSQTGGPTVTLSDPKVAKPTFLAPLVAPTGTTLSFQLTVTDTSGSSASATTRVNVTNVNHLPVANAGPDQTVNTSTKVQLDGTASAVPTADSVAPVSSTQLPRSYTMSKTERAAVVPSWAREAAHWLGLHCCIRAGGK